MFWRKKEETNALPDLPPMRPFSLKKEELNDLDDDMDDDLDDDVPSEKHSLPSFPDSPARKGFAQAAIKDAVSNDEVEEPVNSQQRNFKTVELDSGWEPQRPQSPPQEITEESMPPMEEIRMQKSSPIPPPPAKQRIEKFSAKAPRAVEAAPKKADVFVKIDKFYSARKSLETIKIKITEIEDLLKRIRDTRLREDQELAAWEKEIESVKSRVSDVTENIFEKLEE